jgi:phosphoserine aminotransferase
MKKIYFTTGPTALYPQIKDYLNLAIDENIFSLSHRSNQFTNIIHETVDGLKKLLNIPDGFQIFFLSSGTECMERIIQNLVKKKSYHFINGYFGERFYNIAKQLKKTPKFKKTKFGTGFDYKNLNIPIDSELVCFVQNETSTGVALNMNEVYKLKNKYPHKIFAIDAVSGVPNEDIDFKYIDCAFFSVQKGFGMPSGMGVLIINKKCIEKAKYLKEKNISIGSYHNFLNLSENADKYQTAMTPNMLSIYLCGKICNYLNKYGIDKIRKETRQKADLIYSYSKFNDLISPFVHNPLDWSRTTIVLNAKRNVYTILNSLEEKGFVLSRGYKDFRDLQIRIGNFPMHTIEDVKNLIEAFKSIL